MKEVPQDLVDYLLTMISPPAPHPPAVFWDGLGNLQPDIADNTLTGLLLRAPVGHPTPAESTELMRILRPGAHLLLIAPDEEPTGHTGACRIEDAGFEIRDSILLATEAKGLHYVPKAARSEREAGCRNLPAKTGAEATDREEGTAGLNNPRAGAGRTAGGKSETQIQWKLREGLSEDVRARVKKQLMDSGLPQSLVESL